MTNKVLTGTQAPHRRLVRRPRASPPRRWDMRFITRFMPQFGLVSSLFDLLTFVALLGLG